MEEKEEAGGRRKAGPTGTPTSDVDVAIGPTQSGCRMRGTEVNMEGGVGF